MDRQRESQASLYALGKLPISEVAEFESFMQRDRNLQLLVKELRGTGGATLKTGPVPQPPREQVPCLAGQQSAKPSLNTLDSEPTVPWMAWMPWALAACFAILCVALISIGQFLRQRAVILSEELNQRNTEAIELRKQVEDLEARTQQQATNYHERIVQAEKQVLQRIEELNRQANLATNQWRQQQTETHRQLVFFRNQADQLRREKKILEDALTGMVPGATERLSIARMSILRPTADGAPGVLGASIWSPADQRGLLVLENLPSLPPHQAYQLWLIDPKLSSPASGGLLPSVTAGSIRMQYGTGSRLESVERFAISIEPRNGSPAPTGRIVYAGH